MAKSKSQKMRQSLIRMGKDDPAMFRGCWNGINPISKSTPTLKEKLRREELKHKKKFA